MKLGGLHNNFLTRFEGRGKNRTREGGNIEGAESAGQITCPLPWPINLSGDLLLHFLQVISLIYRSHKTRNLSVTTPSKMQEASDFVASQQVIQTSRITCTREPSPFDHGSGELEDLWERLRQATYPITLSSDLKGRLKRYLQEVVLPPLERIEGKVRSVSGWDDPREHPLPVRERVIDPMITEMLNELHDARDVLNDMARFVVIHPNHPVSPQAPQVS